MDWLLEIILSLFESKEKKKRKKKKKKFKKQHKKNKKERERLRNLLECEIDDEPEPVTIEEIKESLNTEEALAARLSSDPLRTLFSNGFYRTGSYNWLSFDEALPHEELVRVAFIDSGCKKPISPAFEYLLNKESIHGGKVLEVHSFVEGEEFWEDETNHMYHVVSSMFHGYSLQKVVEGEQVICGTAENPGKIYLLKTLNKNGTGPLTNTIKALKFIQSLPKRKRPHIVNGSLSSPRVDDLHFLDSHREIIELLKELSADGIIFNFAGGNVGDPYKDIDTVRFPAQLAKFGVCRAIGGLAYGNAAYYTPVGRSITYALPSYNELGVIVDDGDGIEYGKKSGTSMATPRMTGIDVKALAWMFYKNKVNLPNLATHEWNYTKKLDKFYKDNDFIRDITRPLMLDKDKVFPGKDKITGEGLVVFKDSNVARRNEWVT